LARSAAVIAGLSCGCVGGLIDSAQAAVNPKISEIAAIAEAKVFISISCHAGAVDLLAA
jgi:hypothetical protein